ERAPGQTTVQTTPPTEPDCSCGNRQRLCGFSRRFARNSCPLTRCLLHLPLEGEAKGGLRPPSSDKNTDATHRLWPEQRRDGVKARVARCESLHRRAPHPASLRAATLPLQ